MVDGVPKNTGNAYLIKGASLPDSYAAFKAAIEAGTQGLDLNFNSAGWLRIGTALSKANLLSDTAAAELGGVTTVDAALSLLGRFNAGLGNEYVWSKFTISIGQEVSLFLGNISASSYYCYLSEFVDVQYSDSIYVDDTGRTNLINPSYFQVKYNNTDASILAGKYFKIVKPAMSYFSSTLTDDLYLGKAGASSYVVDYRLYFPAYKVTATFAGYVNGDDENAYPPQNNDGYSYGLVGGIKTSSTKMEKVIYAGTGQYGGGNLSSLTFSFVPDMLLITARTPLSYNSNTGLTISASNFAFAISGISCDAPTSQHGSGRFWKWCGKTVSWYSSESAEQQLNANGDKYIAIAVKF